MPSININEYPSRITQNLFKALKTLRLSTLPRRLWVDAVCINQANAKEKAHQVQLMDDIYRCAKKVLVWIDPGDDVGHAALRALAPIPLQQIASNTIIQTSQFKASILDLLERPWWSRVWVIQEVAMATHSPVFICGAGAEEVPWTNLDAAFHATFPDSNPADLGEDYKRAIKAKREPCFALRRAASGSPNGLSAQLSDLVLAAAVATEATVPQDMVLSMRAMLNSLAKSTVIPNYSVPCAYVYTAATILMLLEKGLGIYSYCAVAQPEAMASLPSWVPDFSAQRLESQYFPGYREGLALSQLSSETPGSGFRMMGPFQLQVDGFVLDEVESYYDFEEADFYREDHIMEKRNIIFCCQLADFELLADNASERQVSTYNPSDAFLYPLRRRGAFYDLVGDHGTHPSDQQKFEIFMRQFRQRRISVQGYEGLLNGEYKPPVYCSQRRLFLTRNGLAGVGVPSLQPGDYVALLFGLPLFFVLRKHEGYHTFVGACRVKGANRASLMPYYHGGKVKKERFLIR